MIGGGISTYLSQGFFGRRPLGRYYLVFFVYSRVPLERYAVDTFKIMQAVKLFNYYEKEHTKNAMK